MAVVTPLAVAISAFASALKLQYVVCVGLATAFTIWLALGAMQRWPRPGAIAWILFAAIAFWSGALAFIGERGAKITKLEFVVVRQKAPAPAVEGLYLGATSTHVYLASTADCRHRGCRRVLIIPDKAVTCLVFGPSVNARDVPAINTQVAAFLPDRAIGDPCAGDERSSTSGPNPQPDRGRASIRFLSPFRISLGGGPATPHEPGTSHLKLVLDSDVLFGFGSARLTLVAHRRLRSVAEAIRAARPPQVFVAGHTDSIGRGAKNLRLSRARAEAVATDLARELGSDPPAIHSHGFGETRPVACNQHKDGSDDPIARAYNRRVEIWTDSPPVYPELACSR